MKEIIKNRGSYLHIPRGGNYILLASSFGKEWSKVVPPSPEVKLWLPEAFESELGHYFRDGANSYVEELHWHRSFRAWAAKLSPRPSKYKTNLKPYWSVGILTYSAMLLESFGARLEYVKYGWAERLLRYNRSGPQMDAMWVAKKLGDICNREYLDFVDRKRLENAIVSLVRVAVHQYGAADGSYPTNHKYNAGWSSYRKSKLIEIMNILAALEYMGSAATLDLSEVDKCKESKHKGNPYLCNLYKAVRGDGEAEKKLELKTFYNAGNLEWAFSVCEDLTETRFPAAPPKIKTPLYCRTKGDVIGDAWDDGWGFEPFYEGNDVEKKITKYYLDGCSGVDSGSLVPHGFWEARFPRFSEAEKEEYRAYKQNRPKPATPKQVEAALRRWMGNLYRPDPALPRDTQIHHNPSEYWSWREARRPNRYEPIPADLVFLSNAQVAEGLRRMGVHWATDEAPHEALSYASMYVAHFLDECGCEPTSRATTPFSKLHKLYEDWVGAIDGWSIKARDPSVRPKKMSLSRFAYAVEVLGFGVSGDFAALAVGKLPRTLAAPIGSNAKARLAAPVPSVFPFPPEIPPEAPRTTSRFYVEPEWLEGFDRKLDTNPPKVATLESLLLLSVRRQRYITEASKVAKAYREAHREEIGRTFKEVGVLEGVKYEVAWNAQAIMLEGSYAQPVSPGHVRESAKAYYDSTAIYNSSFKEIVEGVPLYEAHYRMLLCGADYVGSIEVLCRLAIDNEPAERLIVSQAVALLSVQNHNIKRGAL